MKKNIKKTKVDETKVITVAIQKDNLEQELREMDKEALIRRLNFEENDPKIIKLIEKIIREKK